MRYSIEMKKAVIKKVLLGEKPHVRNSKRSRYQPINFDLLAQTSQNRWKHNIEQ